MSEKAPKITVPDHVNLGDQARFLIHLLEREDVRVPPNGGQRRDGFFCEAASKADWLKLRDWCAELACSLASTYGRESAECVWTYGERLAELARGYRTSPTIRIYGVSIEWRLLAEVKQALILLLQDLGESKRQDTIEPEDEDAGDYQDDDGEWIWKDWFDSHANNTSANYDAVTDKNRKGLKVRRRRIAKQHIAEAKKNGPTRLLVFHFRDIIHAFGWVTPPGG